MSLDYTASVVRDEQISFINCESERETIISHLIDLKRGKIVNKDGETEYKWKKSASGEDHYFFALLYCITASLMKGFGDRFGTNSASIPLVDTFTLEDEMRII